MVKTNMETEIKELKKTVEFQNRRISRLWEKSELLRDMIKINRTTIDRLCKER